MLTALRTGLHFRLALMVAVFAAFCFVVPPAVLAFSHGQNTVDCLTHADMVDHGNSHAHGTKSHGDHSPPAGNHQPSCCGLFCMSALVSDSDVLGPVIADSTPFLVPETSFFSRGPERLDRPPISLLVV
jgi:hypothetical protein